MAIYSIARRTTNVTIANPCIEIIAGADVRIKILEISIILAGATASTFGIGRPAAIGITPTTPVTLLPEDIIDPATLVTTALAWATPPTVPAHFMRRCTLAAAVGAGIVFPFPKGLYIEAEKSVVVWNITTTDVADINVVCEV
jgi:hypothetical protein